MTIFISTRTASAVFAFAVTVVLLITQSATAGALYFDLVVDPPTTAFSGIPAVHGFSGTSSRSGVGTWHLYAIDDIDNSFGVSSYFVKLNPGAGGTIPNISHRSPRTDWENLDGDIFSAGYSDLRSGTNSNPIFAAQVSAANTPRIGGLGISASDFQLNVPDSVAFSVTTNGQWGKYADFGGNSVTIPSSGHTRNPLFLAEGTYTGSAPTIDLVTPAASGGTTVQYWSNANLTTTASATQLAAYQNCPLCGIVVDTKSFTNVDANNPGFVETTLSGMVINQSGVSFLGASAFSNLVFDGYLAPGGGFSSTSPAQAATLDSATAKFHWNTVGAPLGNYSWRVNAAAAGYTGSGIITASITVVPEPATLSLIAFAAIGGLGFTGRRAK